jgi:nitrilase
MFNMGAEILAVPAAFTLTTGKAHWEVLARSRAIENFCYFIGAAQGGAHKSGRMTYGHSLIVGPWGEVIASSVGTDIDIIYANIDNKTVHDARKAIPVDHHQRIFLDDTRL